MPAPIIKIDFLPSSSSQRLLFTSEGTFRHHIAWSPTEDQSWRLNFAGHVEDKESDIGGAAFLIRNEYAFFKFCYATPLGSVQSIVVAELMALFNGLEGAIKLGVEFLEVEGDCSFIFYLLGGLISAPTPEIEDLVDDCLELVNGFRSVKFHCVSSDSNQAANKLAAIALLELEPRQWSEPPDVIAEILIEDVTGRWLPVSDNDPVV